MTAGFSASDDTYTAPPLNITRAPTLMLAAPNVVLPPDVVWGAYALLAMRTCSSSSAKSTPPLMVLGCCVLNVRTCMSPALLRPR